MSWDDSKSLVPISFWQIDYLIYCSSGLPLEKARWLPRYLPPAPPEERPPTPPGTPRPLQSIEDEPLVDAAWDPSSVMPGEASWSSSYDPELNPGKRELDAPKS